MPSRSATSNATEPGRLRVALRAASPAGRIRAGAPARLLVKMPAMSHTPSQSLHPRGPGFRASSAAVPGLAAVLAFSLAVACAPSAAAAAPAHPFGSHPQA